MCEGSSDFTLNSPATKGKHLRPPSMGSAPSAPNIPIEEVMTYLREVKGIFDHIKPLVDQFKPFKDSDLMAEHLLNELLIFKEALIVQLMALRGHPVPVDFGSSELQSMLSRIQADPEYLHKHHAKLVVGAESLLRRMEA